jgi:hypothetical protein
MTIDTTPLPRAQPCQGTVEICQVVRDGKVIKQDMKFKSTHRLEFDEMNRAYKPVLIPQCEHGDP